MHTKDDMTLAVHQPPSRLPARKSRRRTAMTYQQFLQADLGHDHFEWVDGEVIEMPAVENIHAALSLLLSRALADWLDENGGGEVRNDPFQMHLSSRPSGRQPDIQVLRPKTLTRLKRMYLDGPADVVIEIVSTGSRTTDRQTKFTEYEQGSVPEYWLIDPLRRQAEFFVLEKKRFIPAPVDDEKGHFHSRMLPGVWLDVDWLWKPPPKKQILKHWGG
jgi:Uma2 family endonuclease